MKLHEIVLNQTLRAAVFVLLPSVKLDADVPKFQSSSKVSVPALPWRR